MQALEKPSVIFARHRDTIRRLSGKYPVTNIRVFGSVLHGTDRYDSDIDLLVDALPGATLFDLGGLQDELQELLGVHVDLLTPNDIPCQIRESVVDEATVV